VEECLSLTAEVAPEPCETTCDGSLINYCGDGLFITLDCAAYGLPCNVTTACGEDGGACEQDGNQTCVGSVVYECQGGVLVAGPDCGLSGFSCEQGQCVGSGEDCTEPNDTYQDGFDYGGMLCDADTLMACVGRAVEEVDCARLGEGYSCQSFEDASFCGLGSECIPGELKVGTSGTPETCDGTSVVFCDEGRIESVDCTSLGFTGCEVQNDAAHCTPNSIAPL
jgi:hypothetical protein